MTDEATAQTAQNVGDTGSADTTANDGEVVANPDNPDETVEDRDFYNLHEGSSGRLPGVYLDEVERAQAEAVRANREGREPDYDTMGAAAGTPVVTETQLPGGAITSSNTSLVDSPEVEPMQTLPVDTATVGNTTVDDSHEDQVKVEDEVRGTDTPTTGSETTSQDAENASSPLGDSVTGAKVSNGTLSGSVPQKNTEQGSANPKPAPHKSAARKSHDDSKK